MTYLTYDELIQLNTFEERFNYLKVNGRCSEETFGGHRLLNQMLYRSPQWKDIRQRVILRDNGCDLGIDDRPINTKVIIHHLNPITIYQVVNFDPAIFNLNNLICCSHATHNAIHYGDGTNLTPTNITERKPGDTRLWWFNMACSGNKNNKYFYKNSVKDRMDRMDKRDKAVDLEKSNKEVNKEDNSTPATTKQYNKIPIKIGSEILKKKIKDIL